MGIDGLLSMLRELKEKEHISTFKGLTVGVDALPWIYKGCYSCAFQLSQNIKTFQFLTYIRQMLALLSFYDITPYVVIDGRSLPRKVDTLDKRKKDRTDSHAKGIACLSNNQPEQARKHFGRSIKLENWIIDAVISELVSRGVQFVVAPYQADCQLAKLRKLSLIDAAITEDSDLLLYDVNCIMKLDQDGRCEYINVNSWKVDDIISPFAKMFVLMNSYERVDVGILAGCDYCSSVPGIGIKRAVKLVWGNRPVPLSAFPISSEMPDHQSLKQSKPSSPPDQDDDQADPSNPFGSQFPQDAFQPSQTNESDAFISYGLLSRVVPSLPLEMYSVALLQAVNTLRSMTTYKDKVPENYQNIASHSRLIFLLATTYNPITEQLEPIDTILSQKFHLDWKTSLKPTVRIESDALKPDADATNISLAAIQDSNEKIYQGDIDPQKLDEPKDLHLIQPNIQSQCQPLQENTNSRLILMPDNLLRTLGAPYPYGPEVASGRISGRTLQPRCIETVPYQPVVFDKDKRKQLADVMSWRKKDAEQDRQAKRQKAKEEAIKAEEKLKVKQAEQDTDRRKARNGRKLVKTDQEDGQQQKILAQKKKKPAMGEGRARLSSLLRSSLSTPIANQEIEANVSNEQEPTVTVHPPAEQSRVNHIQTMNTLISASRSSLYSISDDSFDQSLEDLKQLNPFRMSQ